MRLRRQPEETIRQEAADIAFLLGAALTMPSREQRDRCIDVAIGCLDRALMARAGDQWTKKNVQN